MLKRFSKSPLGLAALVVIGGLLLLVMSGSVYYRAAGGSMCARCHEIVPAFEEWRQSSHRETECADCHGGIFTADVSFHLNNVSQIVTHLRDQVPEQVRLRPSDLPAMLERCRGCHQQEFASWSSGPHSTTYAKILLNAEHNTSRLLNDNCFRCHGMHYPGSIETMVSPVGLQGPWKLVDPTWADQPMIPCMSCHAVHREGEPMAQLAADREDGVLNPERHRPSLGLYDRRSGLHFPVELFPLPAMVEQGRPVKLSPDTRQRLCYQCHAPLEGFQVGSGDDRTAIGVHEGIGCLGCHQGHDQSARASCANCHPAQSNCGLDVETMDTTFKSPGSRHNIHWVKCADCHTEGVPSPKSDQS